MNGLLQMSGNSAIVPLSISPYWIKYFIEGLWDARRSAFVFATRGALLFTQGRRVVIRTARLERVGGDASRSVIILRDGRQVQ